MEILSYLLAGAVLSSPLYTFRLTLGGIPFYLPEIFILLGLAYWILLLNTGKINFIWPKKAILAPVALFIVGAVIATWQGGLQALGPLKSWVLLPALFSFLSFQLLTNSPLSRRNFENSLFLSAVGVGLVGIGQELLHFSRLESFFNSPNAAAMWLVPIFFLLLPRRRQWWEQLVLMIVLVAIILTKSFGGLAALVVGFVVYLVASHLLTPRSSRTFLTILVSATVIFSWASLTSTLTNWSSQLFGTRLGGRLQIWSLARRAMQEHFFSGIGPGTFQRYYVARIGLAFPNPIEWSVPEPHNLYLATWLSSGLLGFGGFIWLVVTLFYQQIRDRQPALIAALVAILVHGLVDTQYWKNDLSIIFFLIVALSFTVSPTDDKKVS